MIGPFIRGITSNSFQTLAQNTDACVKIETGLKAIGRPAFTLADKNTDKETRKYAATKEFLYQILCLGIYMAIIPPIFKNAGFKAFQWLSKGQNFPAFKNAKQVLAYNRLARMHSAERTLPKNKKFLDLIDDKLIDPLTNVKLLDYLKEKPHGTLKNSGKYFDETKGAIELSSIVGSVIGLTILAPELSHLILHPVMKAVGLEHKEKPAAAVPAKPLDKQA